MKQTIEIEVPDGKKAIWKDGKIVFEDIKPPLPKTWEEFCEHNKVNINVPRGHLALMQLHQLRDCYRQGWIPNWSENRTVKYNIEYCNAEGYSVFISRITPAFLSFQSMETAKEFLDNFRELIEQAGDLI